MPHTTFKTETFYYLPTTEPPLETRQEIEGKQSSPTLPNQNTKNKQQHTEHTSKHCAHTISLSLVFMFISLFVLNKIEFF